MAITRKVSPPTPLVLIIGVAVACHGLGALYNGLTYDDTLWYWVYRIDGIGRVWENMHDAGHPGYFLTFGPMHLLFEEYQGMGWRLVRLVLISLSGLILFRIFRASPLFRPVAIWCAVFFVTMPFYFIGNTTSHAPYEVSLVLYFSSILLMKFSGVLARSGSFLAFILSLSFEILITWELLRLIFARSQRKKWRDAFILCLPYWIMGAIIIVIRLVIFDPQAGYSEINQINLDLVSNLRNFVNLFMHIPNSIRYCVESSFELLGLSLYLPVVGGALILCLLITYKEAWPNVTASSLWSRAGFLIVLGLILIFCGILPFSIINRPAEIYGALSRRGYGALLGFAIIFVGCLTLLPNRYLRNMCATYFLLTFIFSNIHTHKQFWMGALVQRDVVLQTKEILDRSPLQVPPIGLLSDPSSEFFTPMRLHLVQVDLTVPINLLRPEHAPIIYMFDARWYNHPLGFRRACSWHHSSTLSNEACQTSYKDFAIWKYTVSNPKWDGKSLPFWTLAYLLLSGEDDTPIFGTVSVNKEWVFLDGKAEKSGPPRDPMAGSLLGLSVQ